MSVLYPGRKKQAGDTATSRVVAIGGGPQPSSTSSTQGPARNVGPGPPAAVLAVLQGGVRLPDASRPHTTCQIRRPEAAWPPLKTSPELLPLVTGGGGQGTHLLTRQDLRPRPNLGPHSGLTQHSLLCGLCGATRPPGKPAAHLHGPPERLEPDHRKSRAQQACQCHTVPLPQYPACVSIPTWQPPGGLGMSSSSPLFLLRSPPPHMSAHPCILALKASSPPPPGHLLSPGQPQHPIPSSRHPFLSRATARCPWLVPGLVTLRPSSFNSSPRLLGQRQIPEQGPLP